MSLSKGTPISSQLLTVERLLEEREKELHAATEKSAKLEAQQAESDKIIKGTELKLKLTHVIIEDLKRQNSNLHEVLNKTHDEIDKLTMINESQGGVTDSLRRTVCLLQKDLDSMEARCRLLEASPKQTNAMDFTGVNIAFPPQASEADLAVLGSVLNHLIETADSIVESNTMPIGDMTTIEPYELGWYLDTIKLIKDVAELKLKLTGSNCKEDCAE